LLGGLLIKLTSCTDYVLAIRDRAVVARYRLGVSKLKGAITAD